MTRFAPGASATGGSVQNGRRVNGPRADEAAEIAQASALLDVTNEAELASFLRALVDVIARQSGGRLPADRSRRLVAVMKRTAEQTLPTLAPFAPIGRDAAAGASPVATAARVYGLELEGLSAEDRDYEIARQFIRLVRAATHRAANLPSRLPTPDAVGPAVAGAAREFAPGLLPPAPRLPNTPTSGGWVRSGSAIGFGGRAPLPI